jgi:hypothetical protein
MKSTIKLRREEDRKKVIVDCVKSALLKLDDTYRYDYDSIGSNGKVSDYRKTSSLTNGMNVNELKEKEILPNSESNGDVPTDHEERMLYYYTSIINELIHSIASDNNMKNDNINKHNHINENKLSANSDDYDITNKIHLMPNHVTDLSESQNKNIENSFDEQVKTRGTIIDFDASSNVNSKIFRNYEIGNNYMLFRILVKNQDIYKDENLSPEESLASYEKEMENKINVLLKEYHYETLKQNGIQTLNFDSKFDKSNESLFEWIKNTHFVLSIFKNKLSDLLTKYIDGKIEMTEEAYQKNIDTVSQAIVDLLNEHKEVDDEFSKIASAIDPQNFINQMDCKNWTPSIGNDTHVKIMLSNEEIRKKFSNVVKNNTKCKTEIGKSKLMQDYELYSREMDDKDYVRMMNEKRKSSMLNLDNSHNMKLSTFYEKDYKNNQNLINHAFGKNTLKAREKISKLRKGYRKRIATLKDRDEKLNKKDALTQFIDDYEDLETYANNRHLSGDHGGSSKCSHNSKMDRNEETTEFYLIVKNNCEGSLSDLIQLTQMIENDNEFFNKKQYKMTMWDFIVKYPYYKLHLHNSERNNMRLAYQLSKILGFYMKSDNEYFEDDLCASKLERKITEKNNLSDGVSDPFNNLLSSFKNVEFTNLKNDRVRNDEVKQFDRQDIEKLTMHLFSLEDETLDIGQKNMKSILKDLFVENYHIHMDNNEGIHNCLKHMQNELIKNLSDTLIENYMNLEEKNTIVDYMNKEFMMRPIISSFSNSIEAIDVKEQFDLDTFGDLSDQTKRNKCEVLNKISQIDTRKERNYKTTEMLKKMKNDRSLNNHSMNEYFVKLSNLLKKIQSLETNKKNCYEGINKCKENIEKLENELKVKNENIEKKIYKKIENEKKILKLNNDDYENYISQLNTCNHELENLTIQFYFIMRELVNMNKQLQRFGVLNKDNIEDNDNETGSTTKDENVGIFGKGKYKKIIEQFSCDNPELSEYLKFWNGRLDEVFEYNHLDFKSYLIYEMKKDELNHIRAVNDVENYMTDQFHHNHNKTLAKNHLQDLINSDLTITLNNGSNDNEYRGDEKDKSVIQIRNIQKISNFKDRSKSIVLFTDCEKSSFLESVSRIQYRPKNQKYLTLYEEYCEKYFTYKKDHIKKMIELCQNDPFKVLENYLPSSIFKKPVLIDCGENLPFLINYETNSSKYMKKHLTLNDVFSIVERNVCDNFTNEQELGSSQSSSSPFLTSTSNNINSDNNTRSVDFTENELQKDKNLKKHELSIDLTFNRDNYRKFINILKRQINNTFLNKYMCGSMGIPIDYSHLKQVPVYMSAQNNQSKIAHGDEYSSREMSKNNVEYEPSNQMYHLRLMLDNYLQNIANNGVDNVGNKIKNEMPSHVQHIFSRNNYMKTRNYSENIKNKYNLMNSHVLPTNFTYDNMMDLTKTSSQLMKNNNNYMLNNSENGIEIGSEINNHKSRSNQYSLVSDNCLLTRFCEHMVPLLYKKFILKNATKKQQLNNNINSDELEFSIKNIQNNENVNMTYLTNKMKYVNDSHRKVTYNNFLDQLKDLYSYVELENCVSQIYRNNKKMKSFIKNIENEKPKKFTSDQEKALKEKLENSHKSNLNVTELEYLSRLLENNLKGSSSSSSSSNDSINLSDKIAMQNGETQQYNSLLYPSIDTSDNSDTNSDDNKIYNHSYCDKNELMYGNNEKNATTINYLRDNGDLDQIHTNDLSMNMRNVNIKNCNNGINENNYKETLTNYLDNNYDATTITQETLSTTDTSLSSDVSNISELCTMVMKKNFINNFYANSDTISVLIPFIEIYFSIENSDN